MRGKMRFWGEKRFLELSREPKGFRPRGKNLRKEPRCQEQLLLVTLDSMLPAFMTSRVIFSKMSVRWRFWSRKTRIFDISQNVEKGCFSERSGCPEQKM